jgi:hypothetical protein
MLKDLSGRPLAAHAPAQKCGLDAGAAADTPPVKRPRLLRPVCRLPARALYRARQFFQALFPRTHAADIHEARALLSESEWRLFDSMPARDQRHGIEVMRRLRNMGAKDSDLLVAALLHDCGKGDVPVWLRVLWVAAPWAVRAMAAGAKEAEGPGNRRAARRLLDHARLGAARARAAGASAATVRYIEGSGAPEEQAKIAMLRAADDRS